MSASKVVTRWENSLKGTFLFVSISDWRTVNRKVDERFHIPLDVIINSKLSVTGKGVVGNPNPNSGLQARTSGPLLR